MNKNKFHSTACIVTPILAVLGSTTNPSAQEPPRQTGEDVIKIDTALVQVRAVVTDRSGKVVDNLKQEDFEDSDMLTALAKSANLSETEFVARFGPLVGRG